jgi:transcriptional regulator with XRE-family HTH domain
MYNEIKVNFTRKKPIIKSNLKKLRKFRGFSQEEMGDLIGIKFYAYRTRYEVSCKKMPPKEIREKFAEKLGFSQEEIWPTLKKGEN